MTTENKIQIGNGSWVSVAILLVAVTGVGGGAFWLAAAKATLDTTANTVVAQAKDVKEIKDSIAVLTYSVRDLERAVSNTWTRADMLYFASELGRRNPTLVVPSVTPDDHR